MSLLGASSPEGPGAPLRGWSPGPAHGRVEGFPGAECRGVEVGRPPSRAPLDERQAPAAGGEEGGARTTTAEGRERGGGRDRERERPSESRAPTPCSRRRGAAESTPPAQPRARQRVPAPGPRALRPQAAAAASGSGRRRRRRRRKGGPPPPEPPGAAFRRPLHPGGRGWNRRPGVTVLFCTFYRFGECPSRSVQMKEFGAAPLTTSSQERSPA